MSLRSRTKFLNLSGEVAGLAAVRVCALHFGASPRILKNHSERRASTIRERIRPTLPIVYDESTDGHGLHCPSENSDSGVINTGTESRDPVH